MRKIAFDMRTEQFDRMPTPSTITFREPLKLDGRFVRCIVYGEDADLIQLIVDVIAIEDKDEAQEFKDMEDSQWGSILKTYEDLGSRYP